MTTATPPKGLNWVQILATLAFAVALLCLAISVWGYIEAQNIVFTLIGVILFGGVGGVLWFLGRVVTRQRVRQHPPLIRPAHPSERLTLEALQRRASLANPSDREAILANPDAIVLPQEQIDALQVFVAESAGTIQGFAALIPREDGDLELDALFVEPGTWRQGIGRQLIEHCVVEARRLGAVAIHVIGNPEAERFYRACAFEQVGTTDTRFGIGLLMRRPL